MAGFDNILGNDRIKYHFKKAIETDRVAHAYILNGPKGMGKIKMAERFAMMLLCEKHEPCMSCKSCIQAKAGSNPDIVYLEPDKPRIMSVEYVRDKLVNDIQIRPYAYGKKIYIVKNADCMNIQAQNAMLKTLEEPPGYGVIMLLTNNAEKMLPTVRSRCIEFNMQPLKKEVIKEYLMSKDQIVDYQAEVAASFAAGNLGRAKELATSEEFGGMLSEVISVMKYIKDMPSYEVVAAVKRAEEYKLNYTDYLDLMILWFRDVLVYKASQDVDGLLFKQEITEIKKHAQSSSYNGIQEIIAAIEKAKVRIEANVNFNTAIELMYYTIRDNI